MSPLGDAAVSAGRHAARRRFVALGNRPPGPALFGAGLRRVRPAKPGPPRPVRDPTIVLTGETVRNLTRRAPCELLESHAFTAALCRAGCHHLHRRSTSRGNAGRPTPSASAALTDRTGTSATLAFSVGHPAGLQPDERGAGGRAHQTAVRFELVSRDTASKADQAVTPGAVRRPAAGARALITEISADTIAVNALNYGGRSAGRADHLFCLLFVVHQQPRRGRPDPLRQAAERDERNLPPPGVHEQQIRGRGADARGHVPRRGATGTSTATGTSRWR